MNDATIGPLALPFWKTFTFWISLCAWFVTVGGHYASVIPDPYGIIAANVVALVYAILRCLTKRKEGLPWKGILSTSEFTVTSATVAFNLVDSLAQIPAMPPKVLVGLSALSGLLVTVLHHLSGGNSFESKFGSQTLGSQTLGSQTLSNADFLKIAQASLTPHEEIVKSGSKEAVFGSAPAILTVKIGTMRIVKKPIQGPQPEGLRPEGLRPEDLRLGPVAPEGPLPQDEQPGTSDLGVPTTSSSEAKTKPTLLGSQVKADT